MRLDINFMRKVKNLKEQNEYLKYMLEGTRKDLNEALKLIEVLNKQNKQLIEALTGDDIIFPNTDPKGLSDTSNSEPNGLDNIY